MNLGNLNKRIPNVGTIRPSSYPDVVLGDEAGLGHPPRLNRDLHRLGGQQVPGCFPAEEFLASNER